MNVEKGNNANKKLNKKLLENTVMLYIMKFAGYLFSLFIVPYQTRVLSQEYYGALSLALGLTLYFSTLIDFGFMVSGVTEIAQNRNNIKKMNQCLTSVTVIKILLSMLAFLIMGLLVKAIPQYSMWSSAFFLYLFAVILESILPMFFLRGVEDMRTVAVLTLLSKALTTGLVFICVKADADYLLVPITRVLGAALSLAIAWIYIAKKYHAKFVAVTWIDLVRSFKSSVVFFISQVSFTIYRGGNTVILGALFPTSTVALYSCPEKLMTIGMSMSSPISDSLLPHIAKTHNYDIAWRTIKRLMPITIAGGIIGIVFAEPILSIIFGDAYKASASVLRALIPAIAVTPINYIICYPVLVPMGLKGQATLANIIGIVVYVIGMIVLWLSGNISIVSAAVLLSVTECCVTSWRIAAVIVHRDRLKNKS